MVFARPQGEGVVVDERRAGAGLVRGTRLNRCGAGNRKVPAEGNLEGVGEVKFKAWEDEQDAKVVEKQRNSDDPFHKQMAEDGYPYYGAIGGAYEFTFIPTSLGTVVAVRNLATNEELNLTNYDSW